MTKPQPALIRGRVYGYPYCCIAHFELGPGTDEPTRPHLKTSNPYSGTGYRPCPTCAAMPLEKSYAFIRNNRICKSPFPISNSNGWLGSAERFLAVLHAAKVTPDPALVALVEEGRKKNISRT